MSLRSILSADEVSDRNSSYVVVKPSEVGARAHRSVHRFGDPAGHTHSRLTSRGVRRGEPCFCRYNFNLYSG